MIWVFKKSPDKSQISYFLLCNYIDLFIPVAILEADRLFNHAQSLQLAGDKGHTILPGRGVNLPQKTVEAKCSNSNTRHRQKSEMSLRLSLHSMLTPQQGKIKNHLVKTICF